MLLAQGAACACCGGAAHEQQDLPSHRGIDARACCGEVVNADRAEGLAGSREGARRETVLACCVRQSVREEAAKACRGGWCGLS